MTFKPGDVVKFKNSIHTLEFNSSTAYPLKAGGYSFTIDGRYNQHGDVQLTLVDPAPPQPTSVISYPLGQVQTLEDGTQIYHPTNGQPFQLTPTHKGSL